MSHPGATLNFAEIEAQLGGRMGIAALDTGSGQQLSYRGDERFAMCSTFKSLLVANVLSHVEQGWLSLDERVAYSNADLIENSPFARNHLAEGSMPIADLCGATIEISDNTAANLLLSLIGGPPGLTDYLRRLGDPITRLDRTELSLNSNIRGDDRDTTTPDTMIRTMSKILVGDALSPAARSRLVNWMKNCKTGFSRLRAGLPRHWIVGDKTGTGGNGAANDAAIVWPPGRAPIMVAAYLSESTNSAEELNAAHAKIGSIVAAVFA
jgi:beta-lactamase class A